MNKLIVCAFCILHVVSTSPIADADAKLEITDMLQSAQPQHEPVYTSENITVPCTLCAAAMPAFLDFCRQVNGYSIPRISDFVSACSLIGEDKAKERDAMSGCSGATAEARSRGRIWNRKMKCLRIYNAMAKMYGPFDPCTQIRFTVDKAPMGVCHSSLVRCAPPPTDEPDILPPWFNMTGASLPFEFPPLTCPQYVIQIEKECKTLKSKDFYSRSNLDGFCSTKYGVNAHQVSGCTTVVLAMTGQDFMMDLCSSLSVAPISTGYLDYCSKTLRLPSNSSVPDAGYSSYLERVKLYKEALELAIPHSLTAQSQTEFPDDTTVVSTLPSQEVPKQRVEISAI